MPTDVAPAQLRERAQLFRELTGWSRTFAELEGVGRRLHAHLDIHVAVALDSEGRLLSTISIPTTGDDHSQFVSWAAQLGEITQVGIEGTATFGAGLARHLAGLGVQVIDADQPDRRLRRTSGKTDTIDAEIAARAVLNGSQRTIAKSASGDVESLRTLFALPGAAP